MTGNARGWFLAGLLLFLAGTVAIARRLAGAGALAQWAGLAAIAGAVVSFGIGAWRLHRRVDWERVETEQRLWESGALGRLWLRLRRMLLGR